MCKRKKKKWCKRKMGRLSPPRVGSAFLAALFFPRSLLPVPYDNDRALFLTNLLKMQYVLISWNRNQNFYKIAARELHGHPNVASNSSAVFRHKFCIEKKSVVTQLLPNFSARFLLCQISSQIFREEEEICFESVS